MLSSRALNNNRFFPEIKICNATFAQELNNQGLNDDVAKNKNKQAIYRLSRV